jgi:peptide deformylase
MSRLDVYVYGSKVLRKRAAPVAAVSAGLKQLADDMLETMYKSGGIGLAAPQVGEPLRLIVVDVAGEEEKPDPLVLFNPEVQVAKGMAAAEEGCLSVPGIWAEVSRPEFITVSALDREGKAFELKDIGGILARCIQHEIDHLEGVLFVDKISSTDRMLNEAKLKKMAREAR